MKECLPFGRKFKPRGFMDDYCDNSISVQFAEKYSRTFSIWKSLHRLKITEIPHRNILCIMFKLKYRLALTISYALCIQQSDFSLVWLFLELKSQLNACSRQSC